MVRGRPAKIAADTAKYLEDTSWESWPAYKQAQTLLGNYLADNDVKQLLKDYDVKLTGLQRHELIPQIVGVANVHGLELNPYQIPGGLQKYIASKIGIVPSNSTGSIGGATTWGLNNDAQAPPPISLNNPPALPGAMNALKQGVTDAFAGNKHQGYISAEPLDVVLSGGKTLTKVPFSRPFTMEIPESYGYSAPGEKLGYRVGRVVGDVVGNATRSYVWNSSPMELTSSVAGNISFKQPGGFPAPFEWYDPRRGDTVKFRGSPEAATMAAVTGLLGVEGLLMGSGTYNPLNLSEGMRPAGYAAVSPDEDDPRKSTNPVLDIASRHIFGRRGRILPWEEFSQERPNITYDQYKAYKDWKYGEGNDPISDLTMGAIQFTGSNLEGIPELSVLGVGITPVGLLTAALGVGAGKALHSSFARQALDEYANAIQKTFVKGDGERAVGLTREEEIALARNPFYKHDIYVRNNAVGTQVAKATPIYTPENKGYYIDLMDPESSPYIHLPPRPRL